MIKHLKIFEMNQFRNIIVQVHKRAVVSNAKKKDNSYLYIMKWFVAIF